MEIIHKIDLQWLNNEKFYPICLPFYLTPQMVKKITESGWAHLNISEDDGSLVAFGVLLGNMALIATLSLVSWV